MGLHGYRAQRHDLQGMDAGLLTFPPECARRDLGNVLLFVSLVLFGVVLLFCLLVFAGLFVYVL